MDDLSTPQDIIDSVSASISSQEQVLGHLALLADVCQEKEWEKFENTIRLSIVCIDNELTDELFDNEKLMNKIRKIAQ